MGKKPASKRTRPNRKPKAKVWVQRHLPLSAPAPSSQRVLMAYSSDIGINESAAGTGGAYFYRLNSPYDPDFTGIGSSAVPYSTWSSTYQNYRVLKATVRATVTMPTATVGSFSTVTIAPVSAVAVVPSNPSVYKMIPYAVSRRIGRSADGGMKLAHIIATFNVPKVLHVTPAEYKDMDFSGPNNGNPARQAFIGCLFQATGSSLAAGWFLSLCITYEVEWFNPYVLQ